MNIAVEVMAYNAAAYLPAVLESLAGWADAVVIIDGAFRPGMDPVSTDETPAIAAAFCHGHASRHYVRGAGRTQAEQRSKIFRVIDPRVFDWVFVVDSDEIYTRADLGRIRAFLATAPGPAYKIAERNFVNGGRWFYPSQHVRLYRARRGMRFNGSTSMVLDRGRGRLRPYKVDGVVPGVRAFHYSYTRTDRLATKRAQIRQSFPWTLRRLADGREICYRGDIRLRKYTGSHPPTIAGHADLASDWDPDPAEWLIDEDRKAHWARIQTFRYAANSPAWWDAKGRRYHGRGDDRVRKDEYQQVARRIVGPVVEIGSAFGEFSRFLGPRAPYAGVEISRYMVREARRRFPKQTFIRADVRAVADSMAGKFQSAVALQVLEHFEPDDLADVLAAIRTMAPGRLILSVPKQGEHAGHRMNDGHVSNWGTQAAFVADFGRWGRLTPFDGAGNHRCAVLEWGKG